MSGVLIQTTIQDTIEDARAEAVKYGCRYIVEFKSGYKAMKNPSKIGTVVEDRGEVKETYSIRSHDGEYITSYNIVDGYPLFSLGHYGQRIQMRKEDAEAALEAIHQTTLIRQYELFENKGA